MIDRSSASGAKLRFPIMLGLLAWSANAGATDGVRLADAAPVKLEALATGEQLVVENRDGALTFAGRDLTLTGFSGILGYATDAAYVVVVTGSASDGRATARAGRILILPPYRAAATIERFDAERLAAGWPEATRASRPQIYAQLTTVVRGQRRGMMLGRLGRTNFNVAAGGLADEELARRSIKGSANVQAIRHSGEADLGAIEQRVADTFLAGLMAGDATSVAALMDPVPFGNMDLRNGGTDARIAMARVLIAGRDWPTLLRGAKAVRAADGGDWSVTGPAVTASLALRPMGDFIFVRSIDLGGQS